MSIVASVARARVDRLLGRVFAAGAIALSIETAFNFSSQLEYLNQPAALLLLCVLFGTTAAVTYTFWFGSSNYLYMRIHTLFIPVLVFSWPFTLTSQVPQDGTFYPWIWWGMDTGWVAVALCFKWRTTVMYYLTLIFFTQLIFSLPMGGSHTFIALVTDSLYTLLTNASIASIALMIRFAADSADKANAEAIKAEVSQAEAEAKAKERLRLDGLIHDSVLTALISAAQAKNETEAKASSELAAEALQKLSEIQRGESSKESIYCGELFDSIIEAALRIDSNLNVKKNCAQSIPVSSDTASALAEATIQALHNSMSHAGSKATRELSLKSNQTGVKIVIIDNGRGFRVSQVNKGRMGIKVSIIGRMESVGGSAHIQSSPGQGTTVVLEWDKK